MSSMPQIHSRTISKWRKILSASQIARFEACYGDLIQELGPDLGVGRCLGIRVNEIVIRSRAGEAVIPPDDPRLVTSWHAAEHTGRGLWRWTDGPAELPWAGVSGPAVVIVDCTALASRRGRISRRG